MVDSFKSIIVSSLIIGVLIILVIGFSDQFSNDNNTNTSLSQNQLLNNTKINTQNELNSLKTTIDSELNATSEDVPKEGGESLLLFSVVGMINSVKNGVRTIITYVFTLPLILGIPPVVLTTLLSIFIVLLILYGWRTIRIGE